MRKVMVLVGLGLLVACGDGSDAEGTGGQGGSGGTGGSGPAAPVHLTGIALVQGVDGPVMAEVELDVEGPFTKRETDEDPEDMLRDVTGELRAGGMTMPLTGTWHAQFERLQVTSGKLRMTSDQAEWRHGAIVNTDDPSTQLGNFAVVRGTARRFCGDFDGEGQLGFVVSGVEFAATGNDGNGWRDVAGTRTDDALASDEGSFSPFTGTIDGGSVEGEMDGDAVSAAEDACP